MTMDTIPARWPGSPVPDTAEWAARCLARLMGLDPELALDMIGVGERSGSLREMLDEVAVFYDGESEVRLEQLTTTLEPAILVVMGGVVVTILLAIYLPIIQSISNVSVH